MRESLLKKRKIIIDATAITCIVCSALVLLLSVTKWPLRGYFSFGKTGDEVLTALNFLLAGFVLFGKNRQYRSAIQLIAVIFVVVISIKAILFNLAAFFPAAGSIIPAGSAGMPVTTAACFLLLLPGLVLMSRGSDWSKRNAQYLFWMVILVCTVAITGHLLNGFSAYPQLDAAVMNIPEAVAFILLSLASVYYNPEFGVTGIFYGNRVGSRMARQTFPLLVATIVLLGLFRLELHKQNWVNVTFGIALFTLSFIILCLLIIGFAARRLNSTDTQRIQAEASLRFLNNQLEEKISIRTEELKVLNDRLLLATKGGQIGIFDWHFKGNKIIWDQQMFRLYGLSEAPKQDLYEFWNGRIHPSDRQRCTDALMEIFREKDELNITFRVVWPDQSTHYLKCNGIVQREKDGKAMRLVGTNWEITEQVKQVERIRRTDEQYHKMVAAVEDYAIILLDKDGNIQNWNLGAKKIKGYNENEIVGKNFSLFYTETDRQTRLPQYLLECAREQGKVFNESWRVRKDGSLFWGSVLITAMHDTDGTVYGYTKVTRDLTEMKRVSDELTRKEANFRLVLSAIGDNVWEHDFTKQKTLFSSTFFDLTGYKDEELNSNQEMWWNNTHPEDRHLLVENDRKYRISETDRHSLEYRIYHKNGAVIWVLDRGVVIEKDPAGKPLKIMGTHTNITQRKADEKTLVDNEKRFRDLTQNVPGIIYQWNDKKETNGGFTYISPKIKEYFGLEPEGMEKFGELIHPEDLAELRNSVDEANKTGKDWHYEGRLLYPDGTIKWWRGLSILSETTPTGSVYNGLLLDLTKEKLAAEAFQLQQKRFEGIFNSAHQFIGLLSPAGILLEANETAIRFAGIEMADIINRPLWECHWCTLHPEVFKNAVERAAVGEFVRLNVEILGAAQQTGWIDLTMKPIFDEQNKVSFIIPEGRDITELVKLQSVNQEQEEKIRLFIKHTPAAVAMLDNDMKYIHASDRWYNDYGLEGRNIIGLSHYEVFPEIKTHSPEWIDMHQRCLHGAVEITDEAAFPRADGTIEWIQWEIHPWKKKDGAIGGLIMFTEVITAKVQARENLKKLNEQLQVSNSELEQFAYVASHDLQEPLRMVSSFLQLLENKYKPKLDDTAGQYIHFAVDGAERMKALIKDLLAFSRVGTIKHEIAKVDISAVLEDTRSLLLNAIEERDAIIEYDNMPVIKANNLQIKQLFQNILGNALKYHGPEKPFIRVNCEQDNDEWIFSVKDNGIGIDPKYFEKIFVVFQRLHTKSSYSGTGIGLAICKKIVEKHQGKIWVESEPRKGSTFYFSISKKLQPAI